jgi:NADPH-dependent glutamate synthase beta subunit-like oxidoreductase
VELTGRVDSMKSINGASEVGGGDGPIRGALTGRVAGAEHVTAANARTGQQDAENARPMVAAPSRIQLGRATEFAHHDDQGQRSDNHAAIVAVS